MMCGGLHIEMNAFKVLGDLLVSSRWTGALTQANIATSGTADSYLKVSHLTRTRHAHQVTASALYILLHKAYTDYCSSQEGTESLERNSIGLLLIRKYIASSPCNGNHFLVFISVI